MVAAVFFFMKKGLDGNNKCVDVLGDWNGQQCRVELQCSTTELKPKQSKSFKLGEQQQFSFILPSLF